MKIGYLIYGRNWNSLRRECGDTVGDRSLKYGGRLLKPIGPYALQLNTPDLPTEPAGPAQPVFGRPGNRFG